MKKNIRHKTYAFIILLGITFTVKAQIIIINVDEDWYDVPAVNVGVIQTLGHGTQYSVNTLLVASFDNNRSALYRHNGTNSTHMWDELVYWMENAPPSSDVCGIVGAETISGCEQVIPFVDCNNLTSLDGVAAATPNGDLSGWFDEAENGCLGEFELEYYESVFLGVDLCPALSVDFTEQIFYKDSTGTRHYGDACSW